MAQPMKGFFQRHWFLLGLGVCIIAAYIYPNLGVLGGPLHPEITVKYIGVSVIFFISGLSLRTDDIQKAFRHWTLHAYIQSFTFLIVPFIFYLIVLILNNTGLDQWLINGFLTVGCMPPPVSSGVILTKAVGGNEAGAIFNSAIGSFLGILITPAWLLALHGSSIAVPFSTIFGQLMATVIIPVVIGQMTRTSLWYILYRWNIPYGTISSMVLLFIIYTTFCESFYYELLGVDEMGLIFIILLVITTQCLLLMLTFWFSTRPALHLSPPDVIASLFCSTHKSLTLGIPLLNVIYAEDPQISALTLPLLVYHPTQILIGSLLVPSLQRWLEVTSLPMTFSGIVTKI